MVEGRLWLLGGNMVEGLLEINLIITNLLLFYIVVHCYQFKGNSTTFASNLNTRLDSLSQEVQEGGYFSNILLDIADLIEESTGVQSVKMGSTQPATDIPSLILGALMNKTSMPPINGESTKNEIGEIHEEELIPPQE